MIMCFMAFQGNKKSQNNSALANNTMNLLQLIITDPYT
jgi:hypothetical protein